MSSNTRGITRADIARFFKAKKSEEEAKSLQAAQHINFQHFFRGLKTHIRPQNLDKIRLKQRANSDARVF